jgi:hypothetical protein
MSTLDYNLEFFNKKIESSDINMVDMIELLDEVEALDGLLTQKNNYWTAIINQYQTELTYLDGNVRTSLSEGAFIHGNFFNDNSISFTPTFFPLANGWGIGKTGAANPNWNGTTEVYEDFEINEINSAINTFQTLSQITRATGQICTTGIPDSITNSSTAINRLNDIKTKVQDYENLLINMKNVTNISDPRIPEGVICNQEGQISRNTIDTMLNAINLWQSYPDFTPLSTGLTCTQFNSTSTSSLNASKGNPREILALQNDMIVKKSYKTQRIQQLENYLGFINLAADSHPRGSNVGWKVNSSSGLYAQRYPIIVAKMHRSIGTKPTIISLKIALSQQKNTIDAYSTSISALTAI